MDACSNLGLTFIPIEDMMKQVIGFTPTQFMPCVLVTKNIRSDNRLSIISKHT